MNGCFPLIHNTGSVDSNRTCVTSHHIPPDIKQELLVPLEVTWLTDERGTLKNMYGEKCLT